MQGNPKNNQRTDFPPSITNQLALIPFPLSLIPYAIAIIGSREAIEGFSLLGATTVPAHTTEEAVERIREMKKDPDNAYAIIFVTEDLAKGFTPDDEKAFARDPLPAIIPLPSHLGSTGYPAERLSRIVERAVGSDILK